MDAPGVFVLQLIMKGTLRWDFLGRVMKDSWKKKNLIFFLYITGWFHRRLFVSIASLEVLSINVKAMISLFTLKYQLLLYFTFL